MNKKSWLIIGVIVLVSIGIVAMQKKPSCYDEINLDRYSKYIERVFELTNDSYTLKCMDSSFSRGGSLEASGSFITGGNFELFYREGMCSSGGADCGWSKCFATEGNDELFEKAKNNLCNSLYSFYECSNENTCTQVSTNEIRQKCLDGEYEYSIGDKKVISIVRGSSRYSSYVEKGSSDCLDIY